MTPSTKINDASSTLNARERKLPKDSEGNSRARDVEKKVNAKRRKKKEFLSYQESFYDHLRSQPGDWNKSDLSSTREFIQHVLQHPDNFPLQYGASMESLVPSASNRFDISGLESQLTPGFVQSITDKSWSFEEGVEHPIVQVLHTDKGEFQSFSRKYDKVKIVCLTVVDGDNNRLLARCAVHLTETAVHLHEGHVLRLRMFNDLVMKPNSGSPPTAVIVIVQMDVMGSGPFLTDVTNMQTPTLSALPTETEEFKDASPSPTLGKEFEQPPIPDPCTRSDRHCSMYGLHFRRCICDKIPVADQDLVAIKRSCPFATGGSVDELTANQKRNMLYWWYATNHFLICGKGIRGPLPDCLVYAIRCLYPNRKGVLYVGFLEKEE